LQAGRISTVDRRPAINIVALVGIDKAEAHDDAALTLGAIIGCQLDCLCCFRQEQQCAHEAPTIQSESARCHGRFFF
jgi:hypothetical protein